MQKKLSVLAFSLFFILITAQLVNAQKFPDPVSYMAFIADQNREIMKDFMSYTSAVAHGKSARKVESRRKELMQTAKIAIKKISSMPAFEGDKALRDSTVIFLRMTYHILNDDYGKIVNLEEIAERSYDDMEAYLLAQDLANEKLNNAHKSLNVAEENFAKEHDITLIQSEDKLSKKLEQASRVNQYYNQVYLIFFKSYKQEMYMLEAISNKNINAIEQNKNALAQFANEGITQLIALPPFNGDRSLMHACRQSLEFYKDECEAKIPLMTNFYLKEEDFEKIKRGMETKRQSERTKSDIDQYNKAVNEINKSSDDFNNLNNQLYNNRNKVLDNWNKSSQTFLSKHTPRYN